MSKQGANFFQMFLTSLFELVFMILRSDVCCDDSDTSSPPHAKFTVNPKPKHCEVYKITPNIICKLLNLKNKETMQRSSPRTFHH